jgi:hypothetical protein
MGCVEHFTVLDTAIAASVPIPGKPNGMRRKRLKDKEIQENAMRLRRPAPMPACVWLTGCIQQIA